MSLDISAIRRQFPFLHSQEGKVIYLDSAATGQKPQIVIDSMRAWDESVVGNVRRGVHTLTERATNAYESARKTVADFIGASSSKEIIFTKNATEGINLVARSFGSTLKKGDAIVLSILEHHSNIVPWMQLQKERGIELRWVHCQADGQLNMEEFRSHLQDARVRLVAITGQSNVLGVRPDLTRLIEEAHDANAVVLVDGSQWIVHAKVDVAALGSDFFVFSGHKLYGPTGIGVLHIRKSILENMPPFLGGGGMVWDVTEKGFTMSDVPERFEAGTPPLTEAVGLTASMEWIAKMSPDEHEAHEKILLQRALEGLTSIEGVEVLGPAKSDIISGCISFTVMGLHPHDITDILGQRLITLRAGNHCAAPLHAYLKVPASTRMSVGVYTSLEDIEAFLQGLQETISFLQKK